MDSENLEKYFKENQSLLEKYEVDEKVIYRYRRRLSNISDLDQEIQEDIWKDRRVFVVKFSFDNSPYLYLKYSADGSRYFYNGVEDERPSMKYWQSFKQAYLEADGCDAVIEHVLTDTTIDL